MASEDVLERSYKWLAGESFEHIPFLIADLAAEVRELRKDRERIIGLFRAFGEKINRDGHHPTALAIEAICDAAMGATENG